MTGSSYGTRPITRERRSKAQIEEIRAAIVEVVHAQRPISCRGTFYQLVARGVVDKTEAEYKATVCRLLVEMRRSGDLPFSYIADGTRWMRKPASYLSVADMLENNVATYRRMLWASQPTYVEIWLEKDALAGVIYSVTEQFDVPLMVSRGFSSITFLHSAGETIRDQGKPAVIYQLGDHDPSGVDIARHIEKELRACAPEIDITFSRLAVMPDQIEALSLPTRPTKKTDSRARGFTGESVDVDAIPAPALRAIVRDAIVSHIDLAAWNRTLDVEEAERASLQLFAESWG